MMNPDEIRPTKDEVISRIREAHATIEQALGRLTEEQMTRAGDDGWTVKDHLAHLAAWERGIAALLRREPRWEAMGLDSANLGSEEEINEMLRQQAEHLSLDEAWALFHDAHHALLAALVPLNDEDMLRPYSHYESQPEGDDKRPIWHFIAGNSFGHYLEHLPWIEALVG